MRVLLLAIASAVIGFHVSSESSASSTETDLRAFYCDPIVGFLVDVAKQVPQPRASDLAADPNLAKAVARAEAQLAQKEDEAKRLDQYVELRTIELGANSPVAALQRGWDDVGLLRSEPACAATPDVQGGTCGNDVAARAGLSDRLSLCTNISEWLPGAKVDGGAASAGLGAANAADHR
jgi:hypothetical protein